MPCNSEHTPIFYQLSMITVLKDTYLTKLMKAKFEKRDRAEYLYLKIIKN